MSDSTSRPSAAGASGGEVRRKEAVGESGEGTRGWVPRGMSTGDILTKEEAEAIAKKALSFADPSGETIVNVSLANSQNTRMAINRITTQRDASLGSVSVTTRLNGRIAQGITQRFDDEGLMQAVKWAEDSAREGPGGRQEMGRLIQPRDYPVPPGLWSEATREVDIPDRIHKAVEALERAKGYVTAGTLDMSVNSMLVANSAGLVAYCRSTTGTVQLAARTGDNTGSGWAGKAIYDFTDLDTVAVAEKATDKAERSRDPSAVEPARYTVILEPDAYAPMIQLMMQYHMGLGEAQRGFSVFADPDGGTKVGKQVFDERLSFVSDPMDPDAPFCPFNGAGVPFDRTYWVQDGILRNLSFGDATAIERGLEYPLANPISVRIQAKEGTPLLTLEEMIETCERGIYVTRLTTGFADFRRLVFTGVTRDGTWLVERGRITRPIKNMRYVDSHMYFLNNLEAIGEPVLAAAGGFMIPPVRSRDFNFTAIADAV
ncbi:MAG: metallopeptidase TldD-related protein [Gemmatimonadota bacterium]|nr:metallopeptidase TldD-related protein [Gemmatimonadota bacterium]